MSSTPHSSSGSGSENDPRADQASASSADDEGEHPTSLAGGLEVELILEAPDCDPPAAGWLEPMLSKAAFVASAPSGAINLLVVGDEQMAAYHEQYCQVPGTTDVITFDHRFPENTPQGAGSLDDIADLDGDLILCIDEAIRQAAERGHSVRQELLLYAVHGLLHLLGEDDHDPAAYEQMHAREDLILTAIGQGPLFARPNQPDAIEADKP